MVICHSGKSAPSARLLADALDEAYLHRGYRGDINWGRNLADVDLNPDIGNVTDKRRMRELFVSHNIPAPKVYSIAEAYAAVRAGKTLVGRPDRHTKGRGFWKCRTVRDVRRAVQGTRRKRAATHFMEYINAPREYRVHVFRGKSIRISEKLFGTTGLTATGSYTTGKPRHNVKHVRRAAKQAVEAVGLDFGAVDILANDTDCWVLEVNAAPHLGGTLPRLYADTFNRYFNGEWEA